MWQLDGGAAGGVKQQQFGSALVGCNWCPLVQKPCSNGRQHDSVHILTAIHNVCLSFSFSVYVCVCVWVQGYVGTQMAQRSTRLATKSSGSA